MQNTSSIWALLCCPSCKADLALGSAVETANDGHIMTGELICSGCKNTYPIQRGVPRFVPQRIADPVSETVDGFGYQWNQYNDSISNAQISMSETFLDFIWPIKEAYFQGKTVLDAGCGMARFTRLAAQFGAATVVGVDLSDSVEAAFRNTRNLPNVLIIQADLYALPLRQQFDYVFSVGVLHHTINPRRAFDAIVRLTRKGGGISAWVYGRENNGWVVYILNPIRRSITSRLPRPVLRVLAYLIAIPVFLILKGIYRPIGSNQRLAGLRKYLFYFDYLYFLGSFSYNEKAVIIFDHLVPELADYIPREEFNRWFTENRLQDVVISPRNNNSWRGFGVQGR